MTAGDNEIRIAGAGLAGLTAAINLALEGYRPIVYELRNDVGMRFSGDFQYFENWTRQEDALSLLRRANLRVDFPIEPVMAATGYQDGRRYEIRADWPMGYMVRRGCYQDTLDAALKRQALAAGVRIEFGSRADPGEVDIVATGPASRLSYVLVQGMVFETDLPDTVSFLVDQEVAPKVYAYLVAHHGRGVVCACFIRRYRDAAAKANYLRRAVDSFQAFRPFRMNNRHSFGNYGITPLVENFSRPIAGEAAGFQDANWGFGMRLAIQSGYLAARSIVEGKDYWAMARRELIPWVKSTWLNRYLFERAGDLAARLFLTTLAGHPDPHRDMMMLYRPMLLKTTLYKIMRWIR